MKSNAGTFLFLHLLLALYSISSVLSKLAAGEPFLSLRFCLCYAGMIALLGIYAIGWQQIIKRIPLTSAYANKAASVVWGFIWGILFFKEQMTAGKLIGLAMIVAGIVHYSYADQEDRDESDAI